MTALASDRSQTSHARYLAVFKPMDKRDEELARAFNDARRSTALFRMASICRLGPLTDEEMSQFSDETRDIIRMRTDVADS
jgi:hypothetical protein